jgi:class 3 adenylate cyclase
MMEGNIGSSVKMDYTVLGEVVDQAVTLGVMARDKSRNLAVSEIVHNKAADSWCFDVVESGPSTKIYLLAE